MVGAERFLIKHRNRAFDFLSTCISARHSHTVVPKVDAAHYLILFFFYIESVYVRRRHVVILLDVYQVLGLERAKLALF